MQTREESIIKTAALVFSIALVLIYTMRIPAAYLSVYNNADWWHCMTYPLAHGNVFHLLCNIWFLLIIVFYYKPNASLLISSYMTAVVFGIIAIQWYTGTQIAGLSAVIYAILGRYALRGKRKDIIRFNLMMAVSMFPSLVIINCSFIAHIGCYMFSALLSVVVDPIYETTLTIKK